MKKIKIHHITKKSRKFDLIFFQKILVFTLAFLSIFTITNINFSTLTNFLTDISNKGKGLLAPKSIFSYLDQIQNEYLRWPFDKAISWGDLKGHGYEEILHKNWYKIPDYLKIPFPQHILYIMKKYQHLSPWDVYKVITNPDERKSIMTYKRLFTTRWTASYDCGPGKCLWWTTGLAGHRGQDIVLPIGTPIQAIANGIVVQKNYDPDGFGYYLAILSLINNEVFVTIYAHMSKYVEGIEEGDIIKQGQIIGYVGDTGKTYGRPHLHLQINKLGNINDLKDMSRTEFKNKNFFPAGLENVKKHTYDPVVFIESHLPSKFTYSTGVLEKIEIKQEQKQLKRTPRKPTPFKIIKIENPKISGKLTVGDQIKIKLYTTGDKGQITAISQNGLLKINPITIFPSDKHEYTINILALKPGNDTIIISDLYQTYTFHFSIYPKKTNILKYIRLEGSSNIYKFSTNTFKLLGVDILDNIGNIKFDGKLQILVIDKATHKTIYNKIEYIKAPTSILTIKIPPLSGLDLSHKYKLKIKYWDKTGKIFTTTKTLKPDLFIDYHTQDTYAEEINYLASHNIIKGFSGLLLPDSYLTKAQLLAMLVRYKYGDQYEKWKKDYLEYINKNGPIFKDLPKDDFWAPYIFKAWQDGIIKGYNRYSFYNKYINLQELIIIYGRFFNVKTDDPFVIWENLSIDDVVTPYAKAAKKYVLYPFENYKIFEKTKQVNRLKAFVSLFRYIKFKPATTLSTTIHTSSETQNTNKTTQKEQLKKLIESLLK